MSDFNRSRLLQAVKLFNKGLYFDSHEILEDIWFDIRGNNRNFYQGLLHVSVSFYHLKNKNNLKGALFQIKKALAKLEKFDGEYSGVNIKEFKEKITLVKKKLEKDIKPKRLPKIKQIS